MSPKIIDRIKCPATIRIDYLYRKNIFSSPSEKVLKNALIRATILASATEYGKYRIPLYGINRDQSRGAVRQGVRVQLTAVNRVNNAVNEFYN